jgi:hypothetical protein
MLQKRQKSNEIKTERRWQTNARNLYSLAVLHILLECILADVEGQRNKKMGFQVVFVCVRQSGATVCVLMEIGKNVGKCCQFQYPIYDDVNAMM